MTMRHRRQDLLPELLREQLGALLLARRAPDARETVLRTATVEEPPDDLRHRGAEGAVLRLEHLLMRPLELGEVCVEQPIERRTLRQAQRRLRTEVSTRIGEEAAPCGAWWHPVRGVDLPVVRWERRTHPPHVVVRVPDGSGLRIPLDWTDADVGDTRPIRPLLFTSRSFLDLTALVEALGDRSPDRDIGARAEEGHDEAADPVDGPGRSRPS